MATTPLLRTRDLDADGLAFWGLVSGELTWGDVSDLRAHHGIGSNALRSVLSQRLGRLLHALADRCVLSDATVQPPFDADRRCRECGTIHADQVVLQRAGATCFRGLWGDVPLGRSGLPSRRSGGRRRR